MGQGKQCGSNANHLFLPAFAGISGPSLQNVIPSLVFPQPQPHLFSFSIIVFLFNCRNQFTLGISPPKIIIWCYVRKFSKDSNRSCEAERFRRCHSHQNSTVATCFYMEISVKCGGDFRNARSLVLRDKQLMIFFRWRPQIFQDVQCL